MVVGEFTQETDLAIIGGGPAGYAAAFRAAELGRSVALIDNRDALGGTCLHDGCIPTKTLLDLVGVIRSAHDAQAMGITFGEPQIDPDRIRAWIDQTVARLSKGLEARCRQLNIERFAGEARFDDSKNLTVANGSITRLRFRRAIIATGASPIPHPLISANLAGVMTAAQASRLPSIPKRLLVIGHDYSALELATIYAGLGSAVTLIAEHDRLLPDADADLVRPLERRLKNHLAAAMTGVRIASAETNGAALRITFGGRNASDASTFDGAIVCGDGRANTNGLELSRTKVIADESGFIRVDHQLRTDDPRILAAGDVTGAPLLAHHAMHQGRIAAEVAAGATDAAFDAQAIPHLVFTDPNLAWVGETEATLAAAGEAHETVKLPLGHSGRAVGMDRAEGLVKIHFDPVTELVLGIGLAGPFACELIGEAALAIEMGATLTDIAATVHPHPTVGELLSEAATHALAARSAGEGGRPARR